MGYTAGVLSRYNLTGLAITVQNVTSDPTNWRCGAVPILGLLEALPKEGFLKSDLVVKSENVNCNGTAF
jgi:hypothetical protein